MPDITMCNNVVCTKRSTCYRFQADPKPFWQSWSNFEQREDGECSHYWDFTHEQRVARLFESYGR